MEEEGLKIGKIDRKILFELDMNARIPLTELARRVGLSPQNVKYRMGQLERKGVIRGYVTVFNTAKLGYLYYRLYIRYTGVSPSDEDAIIDYFKRHGNVVWFISTSGRWDLEVLFIARNFIHFDHMLKEAYERFPDKIHNNVTSVSVSNYHHGRGYLIGHRTAFSARYGGEPREIPLDGIDRKIIGIISQEARMSRAEIGTRIGMNYKTVQARIKRMEREGLIQAYRTWVDFMKIGSYYRKALVNLRKFTRDVGSTVLSFCEKDPNIIYLITCVWPWDVEIEIESTDEGKFLEIVRSFRETMGDLVMDYETLTVTAEHKLDYCPFISRASQ